MNFGGFVDYLKKLCEISGVAGYEDEVRKFVISEFERHSLEVEVGRLGSVVGKLKGLSKNPLKIMLSAHMDEIGFMVSSITKEGFLKFRPLGGFDARTIFTQRVLVHGRKKIFGVIGAKPIHLQEPEERKKVQEIEKLFIDIGAKNKKDAEKLVSVGDVVTIDRTFCELQNNNVTCKAMDDRIGVAVLFETLKNLENVKNNVYFVASTQEEVGLRGARVSSYKISPDVGIALEVTFAKHEGLEPEETSIELGKGPAIAIGPNTHPKIFKKLVEIAKCYKIPYQIEPMAMPVGTDASVIQITRKGVATGLISVPLRYMHTSCEVVNREDVKNAGILTARFVEEVEEMDLTL